MKRGISIIALVAVPLLADEVYLRGGGQVTGEIIEQTDDTVKVDVGGGTVSVQRSSVVRIEESSSPVKEYRERAAKIPAGDTDAWRELGRWAASEALGTLSNEAYSKVLASLPSDPEANRALGRVQLNGTWVTEEESYRAQGYVVLDGEWMRPAERQAILEARRASEEADRKALAAQIQADEQAVRDRKAREEAESEAFQRGGLPQLGDPLLVGWGYAPAYWPSQPVQRTSPDSGRVPAGGSR